MNHLSTKGVWKGLGWVLLGMQSSRVIWASQEGVGSGAGYDHGLLRKGAGAGLGDGGL